MSPIEYTQAVREHCQKWERIASSTTPANRKQVELDVQEFYRDHLKSDPPKCFWIESPSQARKNRTKRYSEDFDTHRKIASIMQASLEATRRYSELRDRVKEIRHPLDFGRHRDWLPWSWSERPREGDRGDLRAYAIIDFFISKAPLERCGNQIVFWQSCPLKTWISAVACSAGIWLFQGLVGLMDTPEILHVDDQGRLHYENGPALRFRDGSQYHFFHGIRVPEKYVLAGPDEINLAEVLAERNAEVRMALISKIGFTRLLGTVRHWTISEANGNRLIEFRIKGMQLVRGLHLKWRDKIGEKETIIPVPHRPSYFGRDVPDNIDDCEQVRRWTLGWPKEAIAVAET